MRIFFLIATLVLATLFAMPAAAQQKCEGPSELCAQVLQLQSELEAHKKLTLEAKTTSDKLVTLQTQQKGQDQRTLKFVGMMGTLAVVLKILLSLMTNWKDSLFQSDKGKAAIRIGVLVLTLGIFLATNMGFGIPWWQAMILAAGGPLSMIIHEMMKLIPVLRGKAKLPPDSAQPAPAAPVDPPAA